jgi:hypothetical protein
MANRRQVGQEAELQGEDRADRKVMGRLQVAGQIRACRGRKQQHDQAQGSNYHFYSRLNGFCKIHAIDEQPFLFNELRIHSSLDCRDM